MRNNFESNYLAHHGILGMKWGKKNGPPYPLGASDHSAAEKKAGWRKSLGGDKNKDRYVSKRKQRKNLSDNRIVDPDDGNGITGVRMPNGDRLFVYTDDIKKYGVDGAVEKTNEYIKQKTTERKKKKADKEQKALAEEMLSNYDKKDPDAKEAKELIKDISKSNNARELSDMGKNFVESNKKPTTSNDESSSKTDIWNKSSSYNKGFLDYIKESVVKPEMVDDPELLDLLVWEYEDLTGKKAMKS